MIRKISLAKSMFSTKISLAKGIRSKTGAAHPRLKIFWVPRWGIGSIAAGAPAKAIWVHVLLHTISRDLILKRLIGHWAPTNITGTRDPKRGYVSQYDFM